jgi:KDO2-lipid IV(A) lauroyltransferase
MRAFLITLLLRLLALLPLRAVHALGAAAGDLTYLLHTRLRRITRINIQRCFPELDGEERERLIRVSLQETGKGLFETAPLWTWDVRRVLHLVREVTGEAELLQALRAHHGVILAAPHLGCWEIIGLYLPQRCPMTILYRPPRVPEIESLMVAARARGGAQLAPTTPAGVKQLYHALANDSCTAILPDQDPAEGSGVFAPFFGTAAYTMTLLPRLARKSAIPVFFTYATRLPRGDGYHIHFVRGDARIADADAVVAATHLNAGVEVCVRAQPEQYLWGYKRFRTRPKGEKKIY